MRGQRKMHVHIRSFSIFFLLLQNLSNVRRKTYKGVCVGVLVLLCGCVRVYVCVYVCVCVVKEEEVDVYVHV